MRPKEREQKEIKKSLPYFPEVLINLIIDYLPYLPKVWEGLFSESNNSEWSKYFQETFLTVLGALAENRNKPISLNLCYKEDLFYQRNFSNAFEALRCLLDIGIRRSPYDTDTFSYNLMDHIDNLHLRNNDQFLNPLKELLLMLPSAQEFTLNQEDQRILKNLLQTENLRKELAGMCEPPIYYFEEKKQQQNLSLITLAENKKANQILKNLPQYKQDEEKWLKRSIHELIKIFDDLPVLPKELWIIIADYVYDPFLANNLLKQFQDLKKRYSPIFESKQSYWPSVIEVFERALEALVKDQPIWFNRIEDISNPSFSEQYEYKPIKLIEKLIIDPTHHFYGDPLLKFVKSLKLDGPYDPTVDKFIQDLFELSNTHTPIRVNRTVLEAECKIFSSFKTDSSMKCKISAEQDLNLLLADQFGKQMAVDYIAQDDQHVILYVKSQAERCVSTLAILTTLAGPNPLSIHLSPLFIQHLLQRISLAFSNPILLQNWKHKAQGRINLIKYCLQNYFQINGNTIHSGREFGDYGLEFKVLPLSYSKIKAGFFHKKEAKISHPARKTLQQVIDPIKSVLTSYKVDICLDKVIDFVNRFEQAFIMEFAQITSEEQALRDGVKFLQNWQNNLTLLCQSSSEILNSKLSVEISIAIVETQEAMKNLEISLKELLEQSASGKITLMLHC